MSYVRVRKVKPLAWLKPTTDYKVECNMCGMVFWRQNHQDAVQKAFFHGTVEKIKHAESNYHRERNT